MPLLDDLRNGKRALRSSDGGFPSRLLRGATGSRAEREGKPEQR